MRKWVFYCLTIAILNGCSLLGIDLSETKDAGPQTQVFDGEYDKVWRAAQLALARYPIKVNNMDAGLLETDFIKRDKIWYPPYIKKNAGSGERHTITIRMVKGISETSNEAVKVIVSKKIENLSDFFSSAQNQPSDGVEERMILYRIDRELKVERALLKASDKDQKTN